MTRAACLLAKISGSTGGSPPKTFHFLARAGPTLDGFVRGPVGFGTGPGRFRIGPAPPRARAFPELSGPRSGSEPDWTALEFGGPVLNLPVSACVRECGCKSGGSVVFGNGPLSSGPDRSDCKRHWG